MEILYFVADTAEREILEETGIKSGEKDFLLKYLWAKRFDNYLSLLISTDVIFNCRSIQI